MTDLPAFSGHLMTDEALIKDTWDRFVIDHDGAASFELPGGIFVHPGRFDCGPAVLINEGPARLWLLDNREDRGESRFDLGTIFADEIELGDRS